MSAMILYIKSGCPWCIAAEAWLKNHGVVYDVVDVLSNEPAFAEMKKLSGQSKAPVLVVGKEKFLDDFGPEELPDFLNRP